MSLTASIDTPERAGEFVRLPVAAATKIYAGSLVAEDSSGNAVPATDTAGLVAVGRSEQEIDNSSGAAGDQNIVIKRGVFKYANSSTYAIAQANVGQVAYVEDEATVATQSTHGVKAGRIIQIDADGGIWVDTRAIAQIAPLAVVLTSTNGTAGSAADLTALKAETEKVGDDVRAIYAALVSNGVLK